MNWRQTRFDLFYKLISRRGRCISTYGVAPFSWTVDKSCISNDSVIYSAGIGKNIDFERELATETGAKIWFFDPTPTAEQTMKRPENAPFQKRYFKYGLAGCDGTFSFALNERYGDGSYSVMQTQNDANVQLPCRTLSRVMNELGHKRIDLLKLDVEGCEYEILDAVCRQRLNIQQICVEFHHGVYSNASRWNTVAAILQLFRRKYRLVNLNGWDHTFVRCG